jgi:hypothetical protein
MHFGKIQCRLTWQVLGRDSQWLPFASGAFGHQPDISCQIEFELIPLIRTSHRALTNTGRSLYRSGKTRLRFSTFGRSLITMYIAVGL